MIALTKNNIVTVFEDPLTQQKPEGKANLIEYKYDFGLCRGHRIEVWKVQFLSDGFICDRRILVNERSAG